VTGFRLARGGAQERFGVVPDLTVLGKIAGGGLPLAAFGGRAEVMDELAPAGSVYQAGTLSGNPLATAAALVVLRRLRDADVYGELEASASALAEGLREALGADVAVQQVGSMLTVFFRAGAVRNFAEAKECDTAAYAAFFRRLLDHGVYVAPSQFEAMFVATAHGEDEIAQTVEAARGLNSSTAA
jgi:glutamate-1-semialdehyde 2,1-aminomutase